MSIYRWKDVDVFKMTLAELQVAMCCIIRKQGKQEVYSATLDDVPQVDRRTEQTSMGRRGGAYGRRLPEDPRYTPDGKCHHSGRRKK